MNTEYRDVESRGLWGGRLLLFDSLPSTNRWAMEHLVSCRNGDVVCAAAQTAGRGRFSRTWLSPDNRGLALSVILRPPGPGSALMPATGFVAALAVLDTVATFGIEARLKWPNDVMVDGKKISGILAELDSASGSVVLGIGLNVNVTASDLRAAGLEKTATSMLISRNREFIVGDILERTVTSLQNAFDKSTAGGFAWVMSEWARRDWLAGHEVEIHGAHGIVRGVYGGMDSGGALCLVDPTGATQTFSAGDVVRLRKG